MTESIASLERRACSCAELQVFSCYRGWKEACQATRAISTTWRRELSSFFFFFSPARQGAVGNSPHCDGNLNTNSTTNDLFFLLRNKRYAKRFTPQSHLVKLKQIVTVLQNSHTVKPRFTNSSDHEQFGLRTNFPNTKRLRWRTVSRVTNTHAFNNLGR